MVVPLGPVSPLLIVRELSRSVTYHVEGLGHAWRNRQPTITPQCNRAFPVASVVQRRRMTKIETIELARGYSMEWGGEYQSFMRGTLSLIGVLVKNSVVLAAEVNAEIAHGTQRYQAVLDASLSRLRPVSVVGLTTVLGMIPLLPDAFFVSMAVTIMAGLSFATVLTMVVVPTLYVIILGIHEDEPAPTAPKPKLTH